jgi:hypothetical protein
MGKASLGHKIAMAKQDRPAPVKERHIIEARGQLEYFTHKGQALRQANKSIQKDLALCEKNAKLWKDRLDRLEGR